MTIARLAAAAALTLLCACGRDSAAQPADDAVLRPDTAVAEIPPPPPPVCAVMLASGEARVFGVCTASELEIAIAAPVTDDPRAPACIVRRTDGAADYEGCDDLSAAGLGLLEDAVESYSAPEPSPPAPEPSAEQP